MKIIYTEGHYSMDIDGTEFVELDYNKQKEVCHKLVDKVSEGVLQRFIEIACEIMGEYTDLGKCESCGEYVEEYKLEL
jgi:hypothetical protein